MFSPTADRLSVEPVSIEITGDTWTIQTGWSTIDDNVGGNCSFTATHVVTGSGPLTQDEGGYNLIATTADGTVIDAWTTARGGDGCTNPRADSGEQAITVFDEDDGSLTGTVDAHPATLTPG